MFVMLTAHGAERLEFYQVLVVEASSIAEAQEAVANYYGRIGRRLLDFEEKNTHEVQMEEVKFPRVSPNPEGVVAASGTIWIDESAEEAPSPSRWARTFSWLKKKTFH